MNSLFVKRNKYDDYIITCNFLNNKNVKEIGTYLNCEKSVILKSHSEYKGKGLNFIIKKDGKNIYANNIAQIQCPKIINGMIRGAVCHIIFTGDGQNKFLAVKDKHRILFTPPGGTLDNIKESYEDAAVREVFEETGISIDKKNLTDLGFYTNFVSVYNERWESITRIFMAVLPIEEAENIRLPDSGEIEKISLLSDNFDDVTFCRHHVEIAKHALNKWMGMQFYHTQKCEGINLNLL